MHCWSASSAGKRLFPLLLESSVGRGRSQYFSVPQFTQSCIISPNGLGIITAGHCVNGYAVCILE